MDKDIKERLRGDKMKELIQKDINEAVSKSKWKETELPLHLQLRKLKNRIANIIQ